jgi:hypothetical protein
MSTPETDDERTLKLALEVFTELAKTLKQERDEARDAAHSFRSLYYAKSGVNKGGCAFPWEAQ